MVCQKILLACLWWESSLFSKNSYDCILDFLPLGLRTFLCVRRGFWELSKQGWYFVYKSLSYILFHQVLRLRTQELAHSLARSCRSIGFSRRKLQATRWLISVGSFEPFLTGMPNIDRSKSAEIMQESMQCHWTRCRYRCTSFACANLRWKQAFIVHNACAILAMRPVKHRLRPGPL